MIPIELRLELGAMLGAIVMTAMVLFLGRVKKPTAKPSWFQQARSYFGIGVFSTTKFFLFSGWEIYLKTPLFFIQAMRHGEGRPTHKTVDGKLVDIGTIFSGITVDLFPQSLLLRVIDGKPQYRVHFELGRHTSRQVIQ